MIFAAAILLLIESCGKSGRKLDSNVYRQEIEQQRQHRLSRLTSDDGWLTLCGLFWLKDGENTLGSDSSNNVVFPPGKAPRSCGSIFLDKGTLRLQLRLGVEVKHNDTVVASLVLRSDGEGLAEPTMLSIGTLKFYVIERGRQFAVRVKDSENSARVHFKGLEYFPLDEKWRIQAKFEPYQPVKELQIMSVVGTVEKDSCPGALVFELDGKPCRLDAVLEHGATDQLFVMFSDETSGKETYRNGRQLYTALADSNNNAILDFNRATNWPCVFTDYATCPIPPQQNHLPVRVEAGEKMYAGH